MNTNLHKKNTRIYTKNVLFPELSYKIVGCSFSVQRLFGSGHKESLYQEAFEQELQKSEINYCREFPIKIFHPETNKPMKSSYRPDFLIKDKIIVEVKAVSKMPQFLTDQLYDYLRNSNYELGYLINFAESSLKPVRIIFSNDKKNH